MRICIDGRMLGRSGIGVYVRNFLKHAPRMQVLISPGTEDECLERHAPVIIKAPIYSLQEQWELPLKIPRCDLFFTPHFNIPLGPIQARRRAVMIHDVYHLAFFSELNVMEKIYAKIVIPSAIHRSDVVFTNSTFSKLEIMKYVFVKGEKIHPVYPGVDRTLFSDRIDVEQWQRVKKQFSLPDRFFLFVGNLKIHKNLRSVVAAIERVPSATLVVVGKKEGMRRIDPVIEKKIDNVVWLNNVTDSDLPILYQMACALVFPSQYEGFGLPVLEAMACGCPVISSDAASLPEVGGEAVRYVKPLDIDGIAAALRALINDEGERIRLREAGMRRSALFSWEKMVSRHLEIWN